MPQAGHQGYAGDWLQRDPLLGFARPYLHDPACEALLLLALELAEAVHLLTPEVAAVKLSWWSGELERTAAGHPSHPLCRALDGHPFRTLPVEELLDLPSPSTLADQLGREGRWLGACLGPALPAELDPEWLALAVAWLRLGALRHGPPRNGTPVPLTLLAAAGLSPAQLAADTPGSASVRAAAAGDLAQAFAEHRSSCAWTGALTAGWQGDLRRLARRGRFADLSPAPWRWAFWTWRGARAASRSRT